MSKKHNEDVIKGMPANDNMLLVSKSNPLLSLWKSDMTLSEFKILDLYLSRINSHNPDIRKVRIEKKELENALGVVRVLTDVLKTRLKHLMGNVVEIKDKSEESGYKLVTLFEEAYIAEDSDGVQYVELSCTSKAMKYFFNIENLGYLKYKLRCITGIKSRYAYIMFLYIESNRFRRTWSISIEELKIILNCDKEETYKQYKRFNDLILKKVHREINERTECCYNYSPIKNGRRVTHIEFSVEELKERKETDQIEGQLSFEDVFAIEEETMPIWFEPLRPLNPSKAEWNLLNHAICSVPEYVLPEAFTAGTDTYEMRRLSYVEGKVAIMKVYDEKKGISNKIAYIHKLIKQDLEGIV